MAPTRRYCYLLRDLITCGCASFCHRAARPQLLVYRRLGKSRANPPAVWKAWWLCALRAAAPGAVLVAYAPRRWRAEALHGRGMAGLPAERWRAAPVLVVPHRRLQLSRRGLRLGRRR